MQTVGNLSIISALNGHLLNLEINFSFTLTPVGTTSKSVLAIFSSYRILKNLCFMKYLTCMFTFMLIILCYIPIRVLKFSENLMPTDENANECWWKNARILRHKLSGFLAKFYSNNGYIIMKTDTESTIQI